MIKISRHAYWLCFFLCSTKLLRLDCNLDVLAAEDQVICVAQCVELERN